MGKKPRNRGAAHTGSAGPVARASSSNAKPMKQVKNDKRPKSSMASKSGSRITGKSGHPVLMANPNANKRSRNKRHGNPDLSDDDSLPSESGEEDSDTDLPKSKPKGKPKQSKSNPNESDSDIDQFLNEDEPEEKPQAVTTFSDDEDDEETEEAVADDDGSAVRVTNRMVTEWGTALLAKPTIPVLKAVTRAFLAAVAQIMGKKSKSHGFVVEGGSVFNAVVAMCLRYVGPALSKLLKIAANAKPKDKVLQLKKSKKWKALHVPVRSYLTGLTELVTRLHEESVVRRVLKHIAELLPYFSCNPKASKMMFKHLIQLWSSGKEGVRLSAFMTLLRFLRMSGNEWILPAIKKMYVAYVSNSKVTTAATWPLISFMASSLVEVLSIKPEITYQQAFVYIRQMAIHVRNATNQKNKETQGKVYTWPFVHCVYLWSKLVSDVYPNQILVPLVHPLIQVITSLMKLNPVKKFYPLMFHCVRALNMISAKTDIFIPTIPIIFSALQMTDLNKKPKSTSFKPFEFTSMLKFSDSQLIESNYRTGVVDQVYELMVEYLHTQCHRIGFPELVVVPGVQLRRLLKDCKIAETSKKMKQLLTLMESQSLFISEKRKQIQFKFTDGNAVTAWEREFDKPASPFGKFYSSWKSSRKNVQDSLRNALEGKSHKNRMDKEEDFSDGYDDEANEPVEDEDEQDFWTKSSDVEAQDHVAKKSKPDSGSSGEPGDVVVPLGELSDVDESEDEGGVSSDSE